MREHDVRDDMPRTPAAIPPWLTGALRRGELGDDEDIRIAWRTLQPPPILAYPTDAQEMIACVGAAAENGRTLVPAGALRRLGWGRAPERCDAVLSTQRLNQIIAYEPADMTLVAESGVTLAQMGELLGAQGQRLPIDPPFPDRTTIGGLIAANVFGPMRAAQGSIRDFLLGVRVVLADGREIRAGGRVVKNVAGYDLMKLFTGSLGTLGIMLEANLKVRPQPATSRCGVRNGGDLGWVLDAIEPLHRLPFTPAVARLLIGFADDALGIAPHALILRVEGSEAEVHAQQNWLGSELGGGAIAWAEGDRNDLLYVAARDAQAWGVDDAAVAGLRIGLPLRGLGATLKQLVGYAEQAGTTARIAADLCQGSVFMRLRSADVATLPAAIAAVRAEVNKAGGFAILEETPAALAGTIDPWEDSLTPGALRLMQGIKQALDPDHRLSPGRFVGAI